MHFELQTMEVLKHERLHHPHPRVQQKMWAVWLKACGLPHYEICRLVGISENTLRAYLQTFRQGGVNALNIVLFKGTQSQLDAHQSTLEAYFRQNPPASSGEARAVITRLTGIERSPTQVRAFMARSGMKFRKVAALPAKVDPVAQEDWDLRGWGQFWWFECIERIIQIGPHGFAYNVRFGIEPALACTKTCDR